jgi:hypothetical protein
LFDDNVYNYTGSLDAFKTTTATPPKKEKQTCNPAAIGHKRFYEMLYIFYAMPKWMFVL